MADANSVSTPMVTGSVFGQDGEEADKKTYQSLIGSVMFLMLATRPDLAYSISSLSRYNANPKSAHLAAAKRILRYVKGTKEAGLTLGGSSLELKGYADAAFADDDATGRSTCGYVFMLGNGAISWASKRQPLVALSTTEAEYIGGSMRGTRRRYG